ncbi:MotA/TolQ/ExbB proton channel family protein [Teredinibacter turnerae]|uniref:Transporter, MotA/TolQ/ExbB proton channel family n=1 Tax=Teredinibacter turnerae (strain ATCC 39867 / T7901) TaxID=377629 RepID=C5BPW8_TERTT|nr:MotA/TolQ/ExbB proton channel family protein [Teredinibacter turnerae]ACR13885.1 transporter, MotA/TolQ/ExbB proton channel family [Teredinibacter turnerae T7901]
MINEWLFLFDSPVIWSILLLAFIVYGLLLQLIFSCRESAQWLAQHRAWAPNLRVLLSALPLLGLLGTITGLLKTFFRMGLENGLAIQEIISGGIAEALFTTQLGLLMVVPGLLLLAYLNRLSNEMSVNGLINRAKNRAGE